LKVEFEGNEAIVYHNGQPHNVFHPAHYWLSKWIVDGVLRVPPLMARGWDGLFKFTLSIWKIIFSFYLFR